MRAGTAAAQPARRLRSATIPRMKTLVVLSSLLCASGCTTARNAWRELNTSDLACTPLETITVRGLSFHVSRIEGMVMTVEDEPLPEITMTLRNLGARESLGMVVSDAQGKFVFPEMPEGWYQIETCKEGWNSIVMPVRVTRQPHGAPIRLPLSLST